MALFQAWQHGTAAFLVTRLLLGLCESGFIPAGLFIITQWYTRAETAKRFSFFFLGNMLAQALSGEIAYGILHMRGVAGLAGWQWLFIVRTIIPLKLISLTIISHRSKDYGESSWPSCSCSCSRDVHRTRRRFSVKTFSMIEKDISSRPESLRLIRQRFSSAVA